MSAFIFFPLAVGGGADKDDMMDSGVISSLIDCDGTDCSHAGVGSGGCIRGVTERKRGKRRSIRERSTKTCKG